MNKIKKVTGSSLLAMGYSSPREIRLRRPSGCSTPGMTKGFGIIKQLRLLKTLALATLLTVNITCGSDSDNGIIDAPKEPDMVVENLSGTLYYIEEIKEWAVSYHYPGTIDKQDVFILKNLQQRFYTDEVLHVLVSGEGFFTTGTLKPVPAETNVYLLYHVQLTVQIDWNNPKEPDWNDNRNPDLILDRRQGTLYYIQEINSWAVSYPHPASFDTVDVYLLNNFDGSTLDNNSQLTAVLSGNCFAIQTDNNVQGNTFPYGQTAYFQLFPEAGMKVFYTHVTEISYE